MKVNVKKTRVQDDKINKQKAEASEGELEHWKRVLLDLNVEDARGSFDAQVRLDLRARLMQVDTGNSGRPARPLALTIIHHMCAFALDAKADLFAEHQSTNHRSEWIVSDGAHISGLLHRLKELKTLDERPLAPLAANARAWLQLLLGDVKGNLQTMREWYDAAVIRGEPRYGLFFFLSSWDSFGTRTIHALDDPKATRDFTTFFELSRAYAVAVPEAMRNWSGRIPQGFTASTLSVPASWSFFNAHHKTAVDAGERLLKTFNDL